MATAVEMAAIAKPGGISVVRAFLKLVIACAFGLFAYFSCAWLGDNFYLDWAWIYDYWGLPYPRSGAAASTLSMHRSSADFMIVTV
jgi:hypothetical protein